MSFNSAFLNLAVKGVTSKPSWILRTKIDEQPSNICRIGKKEKKKKTSKPDRIDLHWTTLESLGPSSNYQL